MDHTEGLLQHRNGLHVYYPVPGNTQERGGAQQNDIEIFTLNDAAEEANANHAFFMLGSKRLRYRYIAPAQATHITRTEWRFSHDGRYLELAMTPLAMVAKSMIRYTPAWAPKAR